MLEPGYPTLPHDVPQGTLLSNKYKEVPMFRLINATSDNPDGAR